MSKQKSSSENSRSATKQRISELVKQRIQQKKDRELANRPHLEVLRVMLSNEIRKYKAICVEKEIAKVIQARQEEVLKVAKQTVQQVTNMMRHPHLQITVKSDFYASEAIPLPIKDFYRKSSNNFLKTHILQKKAYQENVERQRETSSCLEQVRSLENLLRETRIKNEKEQSDQLIKNMRQKLAYEASVRQGQRLAKIINELDERYVDLEKEFAKKKGGLDGEIQRAKDLEVKIIEQKQKYEATYNIITYRGFLKTLFDINLKVEWLQNQLMKARQEYDSVTKQNQGLQSQLIERKVMTRYGKIQSFRLNPSKTGFERLSIVREYSNSQKRKRSASLKRKSQADTNNTGQKTESPTKPKDEGMMAGNNTSTVGSLLTMRHNSILLERSRRSDSSNKHNYPNRLVRTMTTAFATQRGSYRKESQRKSILVK